MRLNHTSGTHPDELESIQSQSRLLIAQNRCKQQNRQQSMLQRTAESFKP